METAKFDWAQVVQNTEVQTSVQQVSGKSNFQRSEGTGVLHINMNSHTNQGYLIGIPIYDCVAPIPNMFFYDWVMECDSYWKGQDGNMNASTRRLLSLSNYRLSDSADVNDYNELREQFISIYRNRDMLVKTDWIGSIRNPLYFGFYMWVISHTDINNKQICDKNNIPHRGAQGEGRLAFVQFKNQTAYTAWQNCLNGYAAMGQTAMQIYPRLFGRDGFRQSALFISYMQDQTKTNKPFNCMIQEKFFNDPNGLATFVNDRGNNPNAYHILPEWIEGAKDIIKEFLNTSIEESTWKDAHVWDFRRALKGINNCFDFYQAVNADASEQNKAKYNEYVANYGYNEAQQQSVEAAPASPIMTTTTQVPTPEMPQTVPAVPQMPQATPVAPGQVPQMPQMPQVPQMPQAAPASPAVPQMPQAPQMPQFPGVAPSSTTPTPSWGAGSPTEIK